MPLPFRCSQDALFEIKYWNDKRVRFREADFLDHPNVPQAVRDAAVRLLVSDKAPVPETGSAAARFSAVLTPGAPMTAARAAVAAANPRARLVEIGVADCFATQRPHNSYARTSALRNLWNSLHGC